MIHLYDEQLDYKTVHADEVTIKELESDKDRLLEMIAPAKALLVENVRWKPSMPNRKGRYLKEIYEMIKDYPTVGIAYDLSHAYINDEPMEEIIKYQDKITLFHANDTKGKQDLHLPIGQGEIDWTKFFMILAKINYRGFLIIEK